MILTREEKESLIAKYAETPEGRSRLAQATFVPAENIMVHVTNDPTLVGRADTMIQEMEKIQNLMRGGEEYDHTKFGKLLEGLRTLSDEIHGRVVVQKL